ncbi:MAG: helix-turn-helix transcriptional regulator [Peptococcaceae bacterium]|nr:helix-turn-helix transcriptional regulator [Peptococcaceae bacterium]
MDGVFNFDYDFGSFLREIRKDQKISMRELGEVIGMSEQAISQYERGVRPLRHSIAEKIAEALGTSVSRVLLENGWYDDDIPECFDGDVDAYEEAKKEEEYERAQYADYKNAISFFKEHGYEIQSHVEDNGDNYEETVIVRNSDKNTVMLAEDFINLYCDMIKEIENFICYTIDRTLSKHNDSSQ